ncbi:glutamate--tRNA ligase [bacterium]|nr:glutamate--tRNA ligase [bacterium]
MIKTRLAPSPTGELHVGTARTALFNFLFARKHQGKFLLRIEDTDLERSQKKWEKDIIEGLKWLGITWNGEITRQSGRLKVYQQYLEKLKAEGLVYECFCQPEELERERREMLKAGLTPRYSGRCRSLTEEEKKKLRARFAPAWRLNVEAVAETRHLPETLVFKDLVRGEIKRDIKEIGDFVIFKADGTPVFFFAGVVDDFEMGITHVIRGEDHITNTFNQLLLYEALKLKPPKFAHLPLILEKDRSKMSKRKGSKSTVRGLRYEGYLPEAVRNFLALLGWSPKDNREFLDLRALIETFDLSGVKKGGSVFDEEKLDHLNGLWIRHLSLAELRGKILDWLRWLKDQGEEHKEWLELKEEEWKKILEVFQTRLKTLRDLLEADYLFRQPKYEAELLVFKKSSPSATEKGLNLALEALTSFEGKWRPEEIQRVLQEVVKKNDLENGDLFWPVRVALTGKEGSPSPQELAWLLGKEETLARLKEALRKIKTIAS